MKLTYFTIGVLSMLAGCEFTSQPPAVNQVLPSRPVSSAMSFCQPMTMSGTYNTVTKQSSTTAIYSCVASAYTITKSGKNVVVTSKAKRPVIDTLVNVNKIQFSDITYLVDADGNLTDSAPKVGIQVSSPKVFVGQPVTITWNTANVSNCVGGDGLIGSKPNNGSSVIQPTAGGQFKYSISCKSDVDGSVITASTSLIVPMPVYKTSYENKNSILLDNPKVPGNWEIPNYDMVANMATETKHGELGFTIRAFAFADFTQTGEYSALVLSPIWNNVYPADNPPTLRMADSPAKLYFLQKNTIDGKWYDITSILIKDDSFRYTCVTPSYVQIADLNQDNKPDAYIACAGADFAINGGGKNDYDSYQYVVLSQPDGAYKTNQLDDIGRIYGHGATLADIDNDGNIDVITVDPSFNKTVFIGWGNGDGTFRKDVTRFPLNLYGKAIYTAFAIPTTNGMRIITSGDIGAAFPSSDTYTQSVASGLFEFKYENGKMVQTHDYTSITPTVASTGFKFNVILDLISVADSYYTTIVDKNYSNYAIVKYKQDGSNAEKIAENYTGLLYGSSGGASLIKLISGNILVAQMTTCSQTPNPADWNYLVCVWSLTL